MAAISSIGLGRSSLIQIGAAGEVAAGGEFQTIGGVYTGTFTISHNSVDTTNNNDLGYTSMLLGNTTITLSFECRYDSTDDGQADIFAVGHTFGGGSFKAVKAFRVQPMGASDESYSFDGYVTSVSLNPGENEGPVNMSVEIQASGPSIDTTPAYDSDGAS